MAGELVLARPMLVADELKSEGEQRGLLKSYVTTQMVEGTDYGVIPGTTNKTLLKPGAEKLTVLFKCTPVFELAEKIEDWERGLFYYMFRCKILYRGTGDVIAEGFGSANSREGKWRWRNADRKCPACGKATIIKGKQEYGGGWVCFAKKGGCGAKFGDADAAIAGQPVGKVENDDVFTLVNTILKIAKKRALVDGAIALARCSDMFTQDAEDFADAEVQDAEYAPAKPKAEPQKQQPKPQAAAPTAAEIDAAQVVLATAPTLDALKAAWDDMPGALQKAARPALDARKAELQQAAAKSAEQSAADSPPDLAGKQILGELHQLALAAGFDYLEEAIGVHHKALGVPADLDPDQLPAAKALVLRGILKSQRGQPVGAA